MIIGICDDEKIFHKFFSKQLNQYSQKHNLQFEISSFYSGDELLDYNNELDVIFLDIEMSDINGIETAKELRKRNCSSIIIFLTNYEEFSKEGYKVQAFRYLIKSDLKKEIGECLSSVRKVITDDKIIVLHKDNKDVNLKSKSIMYIASHRGRTEIYTRKYIYSSKNSLEYWEKELDKTLFFRCHKQYIVNISCINNISEDSIISNTIKRYVYMINGDRIEVSVRKRPTLNKLKMDYDLSQLR